LNQKYNLIPEGCKMYLEILKKLEASSDLLEKRPSRTVLMDAWDECKNGGKMVSLIAEYTKEKDSPHHRKLVGLLILFIHEALQKAPEYYRFNQMDIERSLLRECEHWTEGGHASPKTMRVLYEGTCRNYGEEVPDGFRLIFMAIMYLVEGTVDIKRLNPFTTQRIADLLTSATHEFDKSYDSSCMGMRQASITRYYYPNICLNILQENTNGKCGNND